MSDINIILLDSGYWSGPGHIFSKVKSERDKQMLQLLPDGRWFVVDRPELRSLEEKMGNRGGGIVSPHP